MEPLGRHHERCNELFVVGEIYRMNAVEERSLASHNHFFAALHDAWLNLPDEKAMGGPTFQKSKDDVLDFVAGLIDVPRETLSAEAGRAA